MYSGSAIDFESAFIQSMKPKAMAKGNIVRCPPLGCAGEVVSLERGLLCDRVSLHKSRRTHEVA